ncbi:DUF6198 family protein [Halodesulfovibrio aestuarii]|uniref:DUF6198 family protein n=1 Tax=Halodesulfovibrio aestuarii TaxID=126333 RepID=A0ABV4JUK1_9BACT
MYKSRNMFKRVVVFVLGLFVMALGVALSVKADLGVSPISCIPYVYSLTFDFSLGELTILMNILFIIIQILILRRKYSLLQLVQLPAITVFGFFIDYALTLVGGINVSSYGWQLFWCLLSCVVIAFGVFLLVKANLTYLPGDGLAVVLADLYKKEFGRVKVGFDSSLVIIGVISSFVLMSRLAGIREGTVIAALFVGYLVKLANSKLSRIGSWLGEGAEADETAIVASEDTNTFPIITISREYGSGGHGVGQQIAKELGIAFYDKELINITAEKSGFTTEYIAQNEQKLAKSLLEELYMQNYAYVNDRIPPSDILFLIQSKIIREICSKGPCVIVGRCANFILKDAPNCFNIFIHANDTFRKAKLVEEYGVASAVSTKELEQSDRERANYCLNYTGKDWRDSTNYHVAIDSSLGSTEQIAHKLIELAPEAVLQS